MKLYATWLGAIEDAMRNERVKITVLETKVSGETASKMLNFSIDLPETVITSLGKTPQEFLDEMRIAAAIKWYELGQISQEKAAEIAGLDRLELLDALSRYQVDFMQYTAEELAEEMTHVD